MDSGVPAWLARALQDRYRLEREIGRGGWGVVYLADDVRHKRPVALKVLEVGSGGLASRERFLREIELEAKLVHPHIVPLFDSGELGDAGLYFVMPFIEGESLHARIAREGPLPVLDAVRIASEVAEALAHAHAKGVIHRDIKPGNILLSPGGALVADFGIARAVNAPGGMAWTTAGGLQLGTPAYMAPEQAAGDPSLDGRADLYALGCVLFEMLAGAPPFAAHSPAGVIARHAVDPAPPVRTVRPTVPPALEAVVARALAKAPHERFPSAEAMLAALEEVRFEESASGPHRRLRSRRRLVVLGVGAVALLGGFVASRGIADRRLAVAIAATDTARLALFPVEGDSTAAAVMAGAIRRALQRWEGLHLVDAFEVREHLPAGTLGSEEARRLAITLGAGRYVRASLLHTPDGPELTLVLRSVASPGGLPLADVTSRLAAGTPGEAAIARLVAQLLIRQPLPVGEDPGTLPTRSLPAVQHYLRGRVAVGAWELDSAAAAFDAAWRIDPGFADAARWLALSRFWKRDAPSSWRLAALAASRDGTEASPIARAHGNALAAFSGGDVASACRTWDALTTRAHFDFAGWYSAALCRDLDVAVLPDARSPTGWRFRNSYHTALNQYLQAFQLQPNLHVALRANSFVRVRQLLRVGGSGMRIGRASDGSLFLSTLRLDDDTLVFLPYPAAKVTGADLAVARAAYADRIALARRQGELFRGVANMWAAADPTSVAAREAQALALQFLGDRTALDTLAQAVRLATTPAQRRRLAGTEVWVRTRFALPDDPGALRAARILADSALREQGDLLDPGVRGTLAALVGRPAEVLRHFPASERHFGGGPPPLVEAAASDLQVWASFGEPGDSILGIAVRLDSLLRVHVPAERQAAVRTATFVRPARLAWPTHPIPTTLLPDEPEDYLLGGLLALLAERQAEAEAGVRRLIALREAHPPSAVAHDALLAESVFLLRMGDTTRATAWLDEAFGALRTSAPDFDPTNAAALVRLIALRADLAAAAGDRETARRWAIAVAELWHAPDPNLLPLVRRMRSLAR